MNNNILPVEEAREKSLLAIDYLIAELTAMRNSTKKKVDKFIEENSSTFAIIDFFDSFNNIIPAIIHGINILATSIFGIDREFLDFTPKRKHKIDIKYGTVTLLNNTLSTLDTLKGIITNDDSQLLSFYHGLLSINDNNFWYMLYNTIENMDIEIKYSIDDRKFFLGNDPLTSYTPDRRVENGLYKILGK